MSKYYLTSYVSAGSIILINSDDCFQFQSSNSVPGVSATSTPDLIDRPYNGAGLYAVKVPVGASWLIVSTPQSDSQASVHLATDKVAKNATDIANEVTNRGNADNAIIKSVTETSKELTDACSPLLDSVLCLPELPAL